MDASYLARTQIGREELCKMEGAEDTRRSLLRAAVSAMALLQSPALTTAALYVFISASQHALLLEKLVEAGGKCAPCPALLFLYGKSLLFS